MTRRFALALAAMLAVGACSTQTVSTLAPLIIPTPQTPMPTLMPAYAGPMTVPLGQTITVSRGGTAWANLTVSDVKVVASYPGTDSTDRPKTAGDVFIQAKVTYEALTDEVEVNEYDWKVYYSGRLITAFAYVLNGPEPAFHTCLLGNGVSDSDYAVLEVPATGEIRMAWFGIVNATPWFEVVIRPS